MSDYHYSEYDDPRCDDEIPFYFNDKYLYKGYWYHINFPENWAKSHIEDTGPNDCENCAVFGSINEVFIGYCVNCADYIYKGSRGKGFMGDGVEFDYGDQCGYDSAFETYLQGIDLNSIKPIEDSINQTEISEDIKDIKEIDEYDDMNQFDDHTDSILYCHFEGGYNDF